MTKVFSICPTGRKVTIGGVEWEQVECVPVDAVPEGEGVEVVVVKEPEEKKSTHGNTVSGVCRG